MSKKLTTLLLLSLMTLGVFTVAAAEPASTPTIDGVIGADWDASDLRVNDATGDSGWGADNDLDDLYVSWDANNIYFGVRYTADGNGMIIYIDAGRTGGETDFNSGNGYTGGWQRNLQFPAANDIDMILPRWNNDGTPQAWTVVDNGSTEVTGSVTAAATNTGTSTEVEYAVPRSLLNVGGEVCVVATIVGGDNWNGPDAAPDNASMDGSGNPSLIQNFYCLPDPLAVTLSAADANSGQTAAPLWLLAALALTLTSTAILKLRRS